MNEPEDELSLRDKFAIEILNGLIMRDNQDPSSIIIDFVNHFSDKDEGGKNSAYRRMEYLVRCAYKMADVMRKVRLTTFT